METTPPEATTQAKATDSPLTAIVRDEIAAAGGRITFARFMALALYHPEHGYYLAPERRPGRGGDFLTAPETHPFFGITIARQIAELWDRLGQPAEFTIREYGAGVGGLAYDILAGLAEAAPALAGTVRYRLIEPNPYRRAEAMAAMREVGLDQRVTIETVDPNGVAEPITGVIIANEVADAFPVHRLVWGDDPRPGLRERYVTWRDGAFAEEEGELSPEARASDPDGMLQAAGVTLATLATGDTIEVSPAAAAWFTAAGRGLGRGYLIAIDYGYEAAELYQGHRLAGTLRAYSQHTVSDDPFRHLGRQDLTAHVNFTALRRAGEAAGLTTAGFTTQGAFLSSLGLGDLLVRQQTEPGVTAQAYLDTRAAVLHLIDPGGMGRFGVLVMARDAPVVPPLRGLAIAPPSF
ncbi:MAG: SAM-dependent methyltransferase [Chloroflexia bacterium]|nr:SAM-dependent methyltransferase [Chloroflexia bacterium]